MKRHRSIGAAVALALVGVAGSSRAATREDVARANAPIFLQETKDPVKDLFTAYDFDGNWNGDDNAENMECWSDSAKCTTADNPGGECAGQKCPLVATVYFTVIETATHYFVQYLPYHPLDFKATNGHEHDTESVLLVIAKDGTPAGHIQAMETRFHTVWYQYAGDQAVKGGADNIDGPVHLDATSGRPMVHVQMVGHGFCGGFAPRNDAFPDLQLTCTHSDAPHFATQGVRYSPDLPAKMPVPVDNQAVDAGYTLVELRTSMWTHIKEIGPGKAFGAAIDFKGERCATFACPTQFGGNFQGNEGLSPGEPWAQPGGTGVGADGDQFFDPAYTMSKRFTFPTPFALDYCFDPYLGVADTCAGSALDGGLGDGGPLGTDGGGLGDGGPLGIDDGGGGGGGSGATGDASTPGASKGCGCATVGARDAGGTVAIFAALAPLVGCALLARRRSRRAKLPRCRTPRS